MLQLPEIGVGGMVALSIISLIGGIILGIQATVAEQLITIAIIGTFVSIGSKELELGAIAWVFPVVVLLIGCGIGNISWAFQTDLIVIKAPNVPNPFAVQ